MRDSNIVSLRPRKDSWYSIRENIHIPTTKLELAAATVYLQLSLTLSSTVIGLFRSHHNLQYIYMHRKIKTFAP